MCITAAASGPAPLAVGAPAVPRTLRRRLNVSRTTKGFSIEVTVEGVDYSLDELMAETEATYAALDKCFPKGN